MFMSGWGLILIDRLAPNFGERQALWLIVGVAVMIVFAWFPQFMRWMRAYRYTLLFGGLVLLALTIVLGTNPSDPEGILGAPQLWLGIGSLFIQPSELLKVVLVVFLASYLAEQYPALRAEALVISPNAASQRRISLSPRIFGPILLMWGLCVVVLVWQRDLGTAILFFMVFLTLLYVASGYTRMLIIGALLVIVAAVVAYQLFGVVRLRIDIWLNPWLEAEGRAYQIVQSLMAFGAGGVFGQGIGQGAPLFIPVAHSDFAFAALAEEWGLLGVISVIAAQGIFVARGLRIAIAQRGKPFNTLLAVGLSSIIALQALLIMGGVLKLIPLTGVTLPFFSYGGSSLVVSFAIVGWMLRLSSGES
jgi:cell division protein FtsW